MQKILIYLKPYYSSMAFGLMIKFIGTIMDLLLPWILAYSIDEVVPQGNVNMVLFWGVVMVLCAVTALVTNIRANRMASKVARDTTENIRHDLFWKISHLSSSQVDDFTIPSLEARLTTDTYNIHQLIGMMQRLGIRAPILLIGGICVTLMLDFNLSLVLICLLPFTAILIYLISKNGIPLYTNLQNSVDSMIRTVREDISGIKVIKALSKTDYEKRRFSEVNFDVVSKEKKAGIIMSVTNPMMSLFLNVGLTLVILVGAYRVNEGLTQTGKIIAFLTYFTIILNAMLMITRLFVVYSKGIASANRIQEVLDTPDILRIKPSTNDNSQYHISFDKVYFSYYKGKTNLKDCSFNIKRGETLGIIGSTGSGKSTLINLLMRLYDVESGEIRISGKDIRSIPLSQLHSKFGVVLQNDILFADTIESNIDFGRNLNSDQIKASAEFAQAAEFIDSLPDGYMHVLSQKSTNLSGGQKQRIMIARALAAKPEILVLDDSSSALDYKTDAMLRKALKENFADTTTIIIAQRISSIRNADSILVMEDGKISGLGKHSELLASCETYREIYMSQTGGGKIA